MSMDHYPIKIAYRNQDGCHNCKNCIGRGEAKEFCVADGVMPPEYRGAYDAKKYDAFAAAYSQWEEGRNVESFGTCDLYAKGAAT